MNKTYNRTSAIISLVLVLVMLITFAASSVAPLNVYAYDSTNGYTGNEDASNPAKFGNNMSAMNKFKMWSVFKAMGMDDNQATAALACAQAEGNYRSEIIESNDPLGICTLGNTPSEAQTYIEAYSQKIDTDADFRTECTDKALINQYGVEQSYIDKAHEGIFTPSPAWNGTTLSLSTYYNSAGVGWLGCGLYGFTGDSLRRLFAWSASNGSRWFEFENQLAYYIAPSTSGGYKGEVLQAWIETTKGMTLDECVETYFHSLINANSLPSLVANRQAIAAQLAPEMMGLGYDLEYARTVLSRAGLSAIVIREGIQDRGVVYNYASAVALYPRSSGFLINTSLNEEIESKNQEVFSGYVDSLKGATDSSSTYSLFELFGEDLHWYRYMGEETYTPTLLDHIWSAMDQHKTNELVSFDTINYDAYNYLSCNVYPNRPTVLSKDDIKNGDRDPRVDAISIGLFNGYFYVSGSIKMAIAKFFVSLVAILTGPEIKNAVIDIIDYIESTTVWNILKVPILSILGLGILFFIVSLVGKAIKYAKGQGAAKDAIERFLISVLCLGFMFAAIAKPDVLNNVIGKAVTLIDTIFNATLADAINDDEVIAVTDPDLAVHAVLWRKAIFDPWCRGQFDNLEYEELYTQYAILEQGQSMMPQSHEEIDVTDMTGKAFFDSASLTGDVFVPVGGGKEIRNWAAYLYSCGTNYHIDSTLNEEVAENIDTSLDIYFPHYSMMTTANDPDLPADLFRIIDAQMDISPQYFATGSVNPSYTNAHGLKVHYEMQSTVMLFNAGLLLFMLPMIIKKITSFILLIITTIKIIYYSILEIFKEKSGVVPFMESFKKSFIDYFTAALKLNIMIVLYYILVDNGFVSLVMYIVCCIVVLGFNLKDARKMVTDAKYTVQRIKNKI